MKSDQPSRLRIVGAYGTALPETSIYASLPECFCRPPVYLLLSLFDRHQIFARLHTIRGGELFFDLNPCGVFKIISATRIHVGQLEKRHHIWSVDTKTCAPF